MSKYKPPNLGSEGIMKKGILTKREREVFELLIDNKTTSEIAAILEISEKERGDNHASIFCRRAAKLPDKKVIPFALV